jgi:hypothetical protein
MVAPSASLFLVAASQVGANVACLQGFISTLHSLHILWRTRDRARIPHGYWPSATRLLWTSPGIRTANRACYERRNRDGLAQLLRFFARTGQTARPDRISPNPPRRVWRNTKLVGGPVLRRNYG